MLRRLIIAALTVAMLGVAAGCGGTKEKGKAVVIADPLAEALAHAPADASVLAVVDTAPRRGASAALARLLAGGLSGGGLGVLDERSDDPAPAKPLSTGSVVEWRPRGDLDRRFSARVVADGGELGEQLGRREDAGAIERAGEDGDYALYTDRLGGALARRGPVLLTGPDVGTLRAVLRRRRDARAQWTPKLLAQRTLGLPRGAIARIAIDARAELDRAAPAARRLPWVATLDRAAVTLTPEQNALRVRVRSSVSAGVAAEELPLALGPQPPRVRGNAAATASVREPRQTLTFLRRAVDLLDPERLAGLRVAETLVDRFANVSFQEDLLDQLRGSATVTSTDGQTVTLRSELEDPDRTAGALARLDRLATFGGPLADLLGVDTGGFDVDEADDVYSLTQEKRLLVKLAVVDGLLVASTDPRADVKAAARAPLEPAAPALGAFRASLVPAFLTALLPRLGAGRASPGLLETLGTAVLTARAAPDGLDAQVVVPIRG